MTPGESWQSKGRLAGGCCEQRCLSPWHWEQQEMAATPGQCPLGQLERVQRRMSETWKTWPARKNGKMWDCLIGRREQRGLVQLSAGMQMTPVKRKGLICPCWIKQGETGLNYHEEMQGRCWENLPCDEEGKGVECPPVRFQGEVGQKSISWSQRFLLF